MTTAEITTAAASRLAVGTRIRDRRVELAATMPHFFTAVSFARRLGITVGHLYQIETGRVRASAALLERIARMLGMEANKLLAALEEAYDYIDGNYVESTKALKSKINAAINKAKGTDQ